MLRVSLRNSDALKTVSTSGPSSKLNKHSPWDTDENWTAQRCPADNPM
jgi:hypothetical protein